MRRALTEKAAGEENQSQASHVFTFLVTSIFTNLIAIGIMSNLTFIVYWRMKEQLKFKDNL